MSLEQSVLVVQQETEELVLVLQRQVEIRLLLLVQPHGLVEAEVQACILVLVVHQMAQVVLLVLVLTLLMAVETMLMVTTTPTLVTHTTAIPTHATHTAVLLTPKLVLAHKPVMTLVIKPVTKLVMRGTVHTTHVVEAVEQMQVVQAQLGTRQHLK